MFKITLLLIVLLASCSNNNTQRVEKDFLLELMSSNPNNNSCHWSCNTVVLPQEKKNDAYVNLYYHCIPIPLDGKPRGSVIIEKYDLEILRKEYESIGSVVIHKGIEINLPQESLPEGQWGPIKSYIDDNF
ncbi:hypothetical protein THERMOT_1960 [Bathymodiolus thermophilus thioautotrophic gill symbiont]|uniref:Lipoprotein n=1 Tax=Bathymodiolus thermophilus thioautotrophic gill symbiont TaxID=2360 RepID=A0A1J5TVC5_9GAMM|nr:hypothetical protein [Bathymodiolus thermophilus thioautotrophic gill symbiont]OIR24779.1 hypothetical protein BGC33_04555 [Bathymodiolus thermophilus thioautotrophic gill symbiont]CAB5502313.1 hypothetical protein THERMOS_1574 [Bathymodiolus thermophilus thioautotrophic gill symbiont]CAB5504410.1 hypothetical protein THERMOT_1960 [Bathymodiolus thermophilus thioautotrophic gill symbiont]